MAGVQQACKRRLVGGLAVALIDDGPVPFEPVALECLEDAPRCPRLLPGRVDVLDAYEPAAVVPACLQVARSRGEQGTEMKWPGG